VRHRVNPNDRHWRRRVLPIMSEMTLPRADNKAAQDRTPSGQQRKQRGHEDSSPGREQMTAPFFQTGAGRRSSSNRSPASKDGFGALVT
jgi:hypothetical protein